MTRIVTAEKEVIYIRSRRITMKKDVKESKNTFVEYMKLIFVVTIMSGIVYFFVFNNIKSSKLDKRIKTLRRHVVKEANLSRNDLIRSEEILNAKKVKRFARNKLGMVNTKRNDYIILR